MNTTKDLYMHGFSRDITEKEVNDLQEKARLCRGDILKMTTLAGSGHPGGSMSSIDIYLTLYSFARIAPDKTDDVDRDRIRAYYCRQKFLRECTP